MIPHKLTIRDFLSYADPDPIEFSGFDIACLTGENGAGKSAILDAITWALFGAARGCEGGQNQDRLIRDGCDEASVDFEFVLNGSTFRVVRRRARSGRSELRFLVAAGDDWTNLAAETLRETDTAITSLLRMDYKTFTASAFFVQGRAEDFLARMRPEERKEVFARLLDLGVYERLEENARGKARDAEVRRKEHARRAEELAQSAGDADAIEQAVSSARHAAAEARELVHRCSADVEARRTMLGELEKIDARLESERNALEEMQRGLAGLQKSIDERTAELASLDKLLAKTDEVRGTTAEMESLVGKEKDARTAQKAAFELEKQRTAAAGRIEAERKVIHARVSQTKRAITTARGELNDLTKRNKQLLRADEALENSKDPRPVIEETRRAAEEQRAAEARCVEQLASIERTQAELDERAALLVRGEGECPVCGGRLDAAHRQRVALEITEQLSELKRERQKARAVRDTARKEAERCMEELKRLDGVAREREQLIASRDTLRVRLERLPKLTEELVALESSLASDENSLARESFAEELRAEVVRLDTQIAATYDAAAHERLRNRMRDLEPYAELAGRIAEGSARRTAVQRELGELGERREQALAAAEDRRAPVEEIAAQLTGLPEARSELEAAVGRQMLAAEQCSAADNDVARLTERLEAARKVADEAAAASRCERDAAAEHRRFQRLTQAFGRGGIPDLIIDNARPGLEDDANAILGRLTDYEMSVHFEMQREMKSGKTKETFDVLVSHEGGVRDYAMFSGGEAFRIT